MDRRVLCRMQVSTKRPMAIPPGLEFLELADRFVMEEEDVN